MDSKAYKQDSDEKKKKKKEYRRFKYKETIYEVGSTAVIK